MKALSFLRDVKIELSKVTWPTPKITAKYTVVVILMSTAVALFLAFWDVIFQWILQNVII